MITLTPRTNVSVTLTIITPVLAIIFTLFMGLIIFSSLGYDPIKSLYYFFIAPVSRPDQVAALAVKACPLIIIASGLVFCYKSNVWNIGAEGQLILGAVFSGWVALNFLESDSILLLPSMMIASIIGGLLWALIPALLKVRFNTNEILVSLMLTYVASLFIDFLVRGPWRDPMSFGFPLTPTYSDAGLINRIHIPFVGYIGQLHYGVLIALCVSIVLWFILMKMLSGFSIRVSGESPKAAIFAGFKPSNVTIMVMCISGGSAGLAGMIEVSANIGQLQPNISFGYGFTAIIVAFLARLNPLAAIPAGLIVALAELGGDSVQISLGMPKVVTGVFKGLLLLSLLAGETLNRYHVIINLNMKSTKQ